jgi:polysaccharide biosynthesis transport protein
MRAHPQTSPYDIDFASFWAGLRRRLPAVLAITAGAGLVTFGALSLVTPRSTFEAQLAMVAEKPEAVPTATNEASPLGKTAHVEGSASPGAAGAPAAIEPLSQDPNRGPSTLLAMAAAWLLGMAWAVTRELRGDASFRSPRRGQSNGAQSAQQAAPGTAEPVLADGMIRLEAVPDEWFFRASTVPQVAQRLLARSDFQNGVRSLVAGAAPGRAVAAEALALVKEIADAGRQVVLIDWSPDGRSIFENETAPRKPGLTDLLEGRASFEGVVARLPGSQAHVIPSGAGLADPTAPIDADHINLVLDALDEVYDHIVIAGEHGAARALFGAMEGRFDAGILLGDAGHRATVGQAGPGRFLGFEVIDIDIIRYERSALSALLPKRLQLGYGKRAA